MSSCGGSVRSFHHDEDTLSFVNEKLDTYDFDSASETSEVRSYQLPKSQYIPVSISQFRQNICNLGTFLPASTLLPSSPPSISRKSSISDHKNIPIHEKRLHPTAYLDGMRGLAAFVVFLCHMSYGTFDITHVYNAGEPDVESENLSFLQLPIVRLLYSGPPMVAIFFVISGYVLSCKPLKQMRNHDYDGLMSTLTSSVFRRALRLFLPCFVSTFIVVCLVQLGIYKLTEDFANEMRMVHEDHAYMAPNIWLQIWDWIHKMLDFINVFDWSLYSGSIDLDRHLWTIPVEFRCSMGLFITHVLIGRMRSGTRLLTLCFLLVWGTYWNRWEMVPFWAGALLAEVDLNRAGQESLVCEKRAPAEPRPEGRSSLASFGNTTIFMMGLFLASYPDADGHISPGYIRLTNMIPERYTEKHRFWPNVGAVMIVWGAGNVSFLKKTIFESYIMQFLGKISFPLYVCHGFIIHTFGYLIMDRVWKLTGGYEDWRKFQMGFAFSAFCTVMVTVWVSHIFLRVVDVRCVRFAKWLEGQLFVSQ